MLNLLNSPITALLALAGFLWLGWYSYPSEHGYTDAQRAAMRHLVASVSKPSLKQKQAAAIRDLWQLTDADIAKPVNLFGAHEHE